MSDSPTMTVPEQTRAVEAVANGQQTLAKQHERVPVLMGVAPRDLDEAWRLASHIAKSGLVPKGYQGHPEDVLVAIQYGMELGLPPMSALHSIFVANGRPGLWGDGFLAVIMASPTYRDHDEFFVVGATSERRDYLSPAELSKDDTRAVCTFWRTDRKRPATASFSIGQAKKAGLWSKDGPWQQYPDRMLKFRARGFAGRDAFPDVLRGVRTAEEIIDLPADTEDLTPPKTVRRLSEVPQEGPQASQAPAGATIAASADPVSVATNIVVLEPQRVKAVEQFLNGWTVRLANGKEIDVSNELDALELEKFAGTTLKVRLTVTRLPEADGLVLHSFAIAD